MNADFIRNVDLEKFRLIAVQHDGRFKTLDSLAREMIRYITGDTFFEREIPGTDEVIEQDPVFTFLDLSFRPETYHEARLIYVKKLPIRQRIVQSVADKLDNDTRKDILKDGRVSLSILGMDAVRTELAHMSQDVMRTARDVDSLRKVATWTQRGALASELYVIPPPKSASVQDKWFSVMMLGSGVPNDDDHASFAGMAGRPIPGIEPAKQQELTEQWTALRTAWLANDVEGASTAMNALAGKLAAINAGIYPPHDKLSLEHWYYRNHKMTWVWLFYMLAVVFLLMGIVYRWRRAWWVGAGVFGLAFCLHTVATGIRWYLAGRIPNSNMFEAVTAAAWFGAVIAVFFEIGPRLARSRAVRRFAAITTPVAAVVFTIELIRLAAGGIPYDAWQQWSYLAIVSLIIFAVGTMLLITLTVSPRIGAGSGLPLLGASVAGMVAMMCGRFMTIALNSDIGNTMPVLNDLWLYIHTNMIITSYALIGIAFVTAALYVVGRLLTKPTPALWLAMLIPAAVVPLPALAPGITIHMVMSAWMPFLIVLGMFCVAFIVRLVWRQAAQRAFDVWEGFPVTATMVPGGRGGMAAVQALRSQDPYPSGGRGEGLAKVLDGATMLLMELSFITLWTGIIMGAVWADHSWGRPWGWDPKEVFALNTWIIFLILVHVRIKVRDKQLWTAVLAVIGCSVMLFNWVVVNFFITGLHSYA